MIEKLGGLILRNVAGAPGPWHLCPEGAVASSARAGPASRPPSPQPHAARALAGAGLSQAPACGPPAETFAAFDFHLSAVTWDQNAFSASGLGERLPQGAAGGPQAPAPPPGHPSAGRGPAPAPRGQGKGGETQVFSRAFSVRFL